MNSKGKNYTPVDEYWAYELPELKRRLRDEFEAEFDRILESYSGDRMFLSFVSMRFSSMIRGAAMRTDLSKRFQELATDAELEHWARMPSWGCGETAALFCGINPDKIRDIEKDIESLADAHELAKRFEEIRAILRRGGLYSISPIDAVGFADKLRLKIPEHLRTAVLEMWGDKPAAVHTDNLHPRTKNNLLRVIAGLAKEARIDLSSTKAASQVEAAVAQAGFDSPKEKTVRDILAEARAID